MPEKVDKSVVQMKIRREVELILSSLLGDELYQHLFLSGDTAWSFRYSYSPRADFPGETIYCGHVFAKAKKKYARFIQDAEHRFAFCVRVRGRNMGVVLNRADEGRC